MRKVKGEGSYTNKEGVEVSYSFDYAVLEVVNDIGEVELLALANRMLKVDANNTSRESAKRANGDSTARVMTAEQKEANKQSRKADSTLLKLIKAKGLSLDDLNDLLK
jgi:hypothetical protein